MLTWSLGPPTTLVTHAGHHPAAAEHAGGASAHLAAEPRRWAPEPATRLHHIRRSGLILAWPRQCRATARSHHREPACPHARAGPDPPVRFKSEDVKVSSPYYTAPKQALSLVMTSVDDLAAAPDSDLQACDR